MERKQVELLAEAEIDGEHSVSPDPVALASLAGHGEAVGVEGGLRIRKHVRTASGVRLCRRSVLALLRGRHDTGLSRIPLQVPVRRPADAVPDADGKTAGVAEDAAQLPAAKDGVQKAVGGGEESLAFSDRYLGNGEHAEL